MLKTFLPFFLSVIWCVCGVVGCQVLRTRPIYLPLF